MDKKIRDLIVGLPELENDKGLMMCCGAKPSNCTVNTGAEDPNPPSIDVLRRELRVRGTMENTLQ